MTQPALAPGVARRRVLFGLLDGDGWLWASAKALFWLVVIIMLLGYVPDRAYYFTVFSTIDIGLNPQAPPASYVTPINLCPAENQGIPCPAPAGSVLPWQGSPPEIALPAGRVDGAAIQVGTKLLFIGGSDGSAASADTFVAEILPGGASFDTWEPGPPLPQPRSDAAVIFSGGSIYVIGGFGADGQPTTTVYSLTTDPETGEFLEWATVDALVLPDPRAGSAIVPAPDGLILVGGANAAGPTTSVLKSSFDPRGALTKWTANADLPEPRTDASAALVGDYLWLYGGSNANGDPTAAVLRGFLETPEPDPDAAPNDPDPLSFIARWDATAGPANLPVARTRAAGFTANGALYLIGGSDGASDRPDVYWTIPSAQGDLPSWRTEPKTNLPAGLAGAAPLVSGSTAFVIGGESDGTMVVSTARSSLAPKPPFFQLGLLGMTIPALKIEGEVGQQLGYMNAAGVGTVNFIILLVIGWAFANKAKAMSFWDRLVRRRRRR
jgi:hypothetical protein